MELTEPMNLPLRSLTQGTETAHVTLNFRISVVLPLVYLKGEFYMDSKVEVTLNALISTGLQSLSAE
jgi:hypothetical protein